MKALLLLSGGIDSPVAGKRMINLGLDVDALHFSGQPVVTSDAEDKCRHLAKIIGCRKLFIIPFGNVLAQIASYCNRRFYYIIQRRIMFMIAEQLARLHGYDALITGDNLGQVGSQTVENMYVINAAAKMRVIRPIICNDKVDTIHEAVEIGTYEISSGPEMCSALGPKHPATRSRLEAVESEEKNLEINRIIDEALSAVEITQNVPKAPRLTEDGIVLSSKMRLSRRCKPRASARG